MLKLSVSCSAGVMILLYNFGFGCIVDHEQIRDIIRRPVAPAIGAACQFLVMAPLSFGIAVALKLNSMTGETNRRIVKAPGFDSRPAPFQFEFGFMLKMEVPFALFYP